MNHQVNLEYGKFIKENDIQINKKVCSIILFTNLAGPLMALGKYLHLLKYVSYYSCIVALVATVILSVIVLFLRSKPQMYNLTKYFGLFALELFVLLLAQEATIGIYLCFAMVPFLSCMYYNTKLTGIVTATGYIVMVISLRLRSYGACEIYYVNDDPDIWFRGFLVSFSIEYIFVAIVSIFLVYRLEKSLKRLYDLNCKAKAFQTELTRSFANLVECRDNGTGEHIKNTSAYVRIIANKLKEEGYYTDILTDTVIELYEQTAPLHDLGKISVPDAILTKPSKLTNEEYEIMKKHTDEGAKMIMENMSKIDSPEYVKTAVDMALCHQEKWDGTGYPRGLKGEEIPLCARIMSAADVLDALLSKRAYKEKMSIDTALQIIGESKGKHFEPCIAECVLRCREEIKQHLEEESSVNL